MCDFSFVQGLSKLMNLNTSWLGTLESLILVSDTLAEEYCLYSDFLCEEQHLCVKVTVPYTYSDIKIEWVSEVYRYYLSMGVSLKIVKGEM